jgi:hypothetical protein
MWLGAERVGKPELDLIAKRQDAAVVRASTYRGQPMTTMPLPGLVDLIPGRRVHTDADRPRFFSFVVVDPAPAGCWWWRGAVSAPSGYGPFSVMVDGRPRTVASHRFAAELVHGWFPSAPGTWDPNTVVMHECDERLCVRYEQGHVRAGTQGENMRHAVAAGRHRVPRPVLLDSRGPYGRSIAITRALARGWDRSALEAAISVGAHPTPF